MTTENSTNQEMAEGLIKSLKTDASIEAIARLNNLAVKLGEGGENDIAKRLLEEALRIYEKRYGEDAGIATMLCNLGHRYLDQNDCVTARSFYERALAVHQKIGSPIESKASALVALGLAWQREGDDRQFDTSAAMSRSINARTYFQRALTIYQEKLGAEHLETAACLMELARTYRLENISTGFWVPSSPDETELPLRYLERVLEIRETQLGHDHPDTINCLFAVTFGSSNAGHKSRSRHYFESLLTLFEAKAADELNPLTGNRFLYLVVNVEPYLSQDENEAAHQRLIALFPRVFSESGGAELTEV